MPAMPPKPPPRKPSGEYGYAVREEQPRVPSERSPEPPRSMSPPGLRVDIKENGFDARVRGNFLRRFAPWIVPAVMSLLGYPSGLVLGFYEGLKKAAARVAADEVAIDEAKAMIELTKKGVNHVAVEMDDHDERILRLERTLKLDPEAAKILSSPTLIVKKPAVP
jgi:hypothetical protein